MPKEIQNKIDEEFEKAATNKWSGSSLKCWRPDCKNIATGQDGAGWEWCEKHFDPENTGSVLHTKQKEYDIEYYSKIIDSKLQEAIKGERERIIEALGELTHYHNDKGVNEIKDGLDYVEVEELNNVIKSL